MIRALLVLFLVILVMLVSGCANTSTLYLLPHRTNSTIISIANHKWDLQKIACEQCSQNEKSCFSDNAYWEVIVKYPGEWGKPKDLSCYAYINGRRDNIENLFTALGEGKTKIYGLAGLRIDKENKITYCCQDPTNNKEYVCSEEATLPFLC